jgi:hypothetical protein
MEKLEQLKKELFGLREESRRIIERKRELKRKIRQIEEENGIRKNRGYKNVKCFGCGKQGHYVNNCKEKLEKELKKILGVTKENEEHENMNKVIEVLESSEKEVNIRIKVPLQIEEMRDGSVKMIKEDREIKDENRVYEVKEVNMVNPRKRYTIYNDENGIIKDYRANNRQFNEYRAVKFYKGKSAINYLGNRKDVKKHLEKQVIERKEENIKKVNFIECKPKEN